MKTETFYDPATYTLTYVVYDPESRDAVVIDPVLDYDPGASQTSTRSVDEVLAFVERQDLCVHYVLETHAHADHLSGSQRLRQRLDAKVAIGARITEVQSVFKDVFALADDFATDGSQFDRLLADGEVIEAGRLRVTALATPGHTPACMSFLIDDAVFTGDALFMEDYGVGRCDFPRGSAEALYASVHERLYALPDATRVFVGHDYQPGGRALLFETTIGRSKRANVQLRDETALDDFVAMRKARDATLAAPRLLLPSVQVNVNAGCLPKADAKGRRFLNLPINLFAPTDDTGAKRAV
jgi:glyoxylase-like metal-dependent hydrolase (beta-lactamase superfamily II)